MNVKKKHGCKKGAIREELNPLARLTPPLFSERFIDPVFLPQPVAFVFPSIFQCDGCMFAWGFGGFWGCARYGRIGKSRGSLPKVEATVFSKYPLQSLLVTALISIL